MNIVINASYYCSATACIELPIKDWSEIKQWYIKWDTLHYTLDGDNWLEEDLNSDAMDGIDWKRPDKTTIRNEDWSEIYAEN